MPNMDYSLIHRTPDGTGKVLVTTPGSPDKGSWESEAELKNWILADALLPADIVNDLTTADPTKVLSAEQGTVLKQLIDAVSGGITPKGDILSSNLPPADASNKGWQYYCTDLNKYATSDGTQWVYTSNSQIVQTPDATDTGHALSNAVVTQKCNAVEATLNQHDARLENLEQKAGDYTTVQYRGTNAVPTGKAKYGLAKSIVGKTRAWNQLVTSVNGASEVNGITRTAIGTSLRYTGTCTTSANYTCATFSPSAIFGHTYLINLNATLPSGCRINLGNTDKQSIYLGTIGAGLLSFGVFINSGTSNLDFTVSPCIYDLTLIFGSGNEPSTVADALALLPALGQYNAYDDGSLVDTELSGVKSVFVNIWDEEWEVGRIASSSGINADTGYDIRSKNYIPVFPSTTYYFLVPPTGAIFFYDYSKNFISTTGSMNSGVFSTPSNCVFIRFCTYSGSGYTTYNHDIQICLNSYADKTTYHPYKTDTLSLSETVTLRSSLTKQDESILETGEVHRPVKQVTLDGTEAWGIMNVNPYVFYHKPSDSDGNVSRHAICDKYAMAFASWGSMPDKTFQDDSGYLGFRDDSSNATTVDEWKAWLASHPITIVYELATPTTETIDPITNNFIEVEGGGTIDTIQTQTPVIDNCLDVGYLTV